MNFRFCPLIFTFFFLVPELLIAQEAEKVTANKERMIQAVRFLSETNFPRSVDNENKEKTIDFIVQSVSAAGMKVTRDGFAIKQILCDTDFPDTQSQINENVVIEMYAYMFTNISALKKGKTRKRIIIGAHYDTVPESPGADDNASGIAVLIELAHLLSKTSELNCDVEFVFYDLEESGLIGSRYQAQKSKNQNTDIVCMISLDMVGYFSEAEHSQDYPVSALSLLYGTKGDFLVMAGKPKDAALLTNIHKAFQQGTELKVIPFPVPKGLEILLARSDHGYYWKEGFPAFFLTDTAEYRNKNYHQRSDTWNTLDYGRLAEVPIGLYNAILAIDAMQTH